MGSRTWRASALVATICLVQCAPGADANTDVVVLRELHEKVMRAHRQNDVEMLLEDAAADFVVANRGEVTRPTVAERRDRLGPYLRSTRFKEYRDLIEPVVKVSSDGTLGWVIVQVQATGVQTDTEGREEPLEFVCAWIELYEKRNGRWISVGNASSFK